MEIVDKGSCPVGIAVRRLEPLDVFELDGELYLRLYYGGGESVPVVPLEVRRAESIGIPKETPVVPRTSKLIVE